LQGTYIDHKFDPNVGFNIPYILPSAAVCEFSALAKISWIFFQGMACLAFLVYTFFLRSLMNTKFDGRNLTVLGGYLMDRWGVFFWRWGEKKTFHNFKKCGRKPEGLYSLQPTGQMVQGDILIIPRAPSILCLPTFTINLSRSYYQVNVL